MKIKKYRQLDEFLTNIVTKAQRKLHILPSPLLFVTIDEHDKDGGIKQRITFKSNSFVRNAYNVLAYQSGAAYGYGSGTFGDGYLTIKNTAGTSYNFSSLPGGYQYVVAATAFRSSATVGTPDSRISFSDAGGVRAGSSDQAETFDDCNLISEIAHGTGTGQLTYGTASYTGPLWDGDNRYLYSTYGRLFSNTSGDDITIKEIGLFNYVGLRSHVYDANYNSQKCLWARDVLPTPITIPNGASRMITYTIKFAY